jgi:hypothetical protein
MRTIIISILIYVASLSPSAWGADVKPSNERPNKKLPIDLLYLDVMVSVYKYSKNFPEGKIRPRILAYALFVADSATIPGLDVSKIAAKYHMPYYDGARVIFLLTRHGWTNMLLRPGIDVKANQVVEVDLPAATDFRDLNNMDKVRADLVSLQTSGKYGVQSVRPDCVRNESNKMVFVVKCGGKDVPIVVNEGQFTIKTTGWLTLLSVGRIEP